MHTPPEEDPPPPELLPGTLEDPPDDTMDVPPLDPTPEDAPETALDAPELLAPPLEDATWDVPALLPEFPTEEPIPEDPMVEDPVPEDAAALELPTRELLLPVLEARELPEDTTPLDEDDPAPPEDELLLESPVFPVQPRPTATHKPTAPQRARIMQTPLKSHGRVTTYHGVPAHRDGVRLLTPVRG